MIRCSINLYRRLASFWISSALWVFCLGPIANQGAGQTPGIPWTGDPGIAETVESIMERDNPLGTEPDQVVPHSVSDRNNLPQNPDSPIAAQFPPAGPFSGNPVTSTNNVATSFPGADLNESGFVPPDSMGDVSPTQILICVNGRIKVFDKNGNLGALNTTTDNFFTSVRSVSGTSDPRVRYDRLTGRWWVVMINVANTANRILVAVSSGATITDTSSFTFFQFEHDTVGATPNADSFAFADYPTLGVDRHALYVGVNVFTSIGVGRLGSTGFVINKSNLLTGILTVTAFRQLSSTISSGGPTTPQGVDNDDPASTEGYFIGVAQSQFGQLVMRRISIPDGTPAISGNLNLTVPTTASPLGGVPAKGSTVALDDIDDRLFAARMHKGSLWTAQNIQVNASGVASSSGGRNGARWYEITNLTATPALRQSGTLFDTNASSPRSFWIPTCAMSGQGHMLIGCSVAGANEFAEIALASRTVDDPLGFIRAPIVAQSSSTAYNPGDVSNPYRWGDYSIVTVDPSDDMTFWTVQEYCSAANVWGVRVIQFKAPPPATPISCNPDSVNPGDSGINVAVTGFSTNDSGFFDPGPGFPNHLSATVSGSGVTVDQTAFTDATQLRLTLTVAANAAPGARTVTVTNPDNQSVTSATGILAIGGTDYVSLNITLTNANVALNWPVAAAGFTLQATPFLSPPITWVNVTNTPTTNNNLNLVVLPTTNTTRFFRLAKP